MRACPSCISHYHVHSALKLQIQSSSFAHLHTGRAAHSPRNPRRCRQPAAWWRGRRRPAGRGRRHGGPAARAEPACGWGDRRIYQGSIKEDALLLRDTKAAAGCGGGSGCGANSPSIGCRHRFVAFFMLPTCTGEPRRAARWAPATGSRGFASASAMAAGRGVCS